MNEPTMSEVRKAEALISLARSVERFVDLLERLEKYALARIAQEDAHRPRR